MPQRFDVLIAGGGINGCGIAQAAAACGYRTLLVEQGILGSGTSSRSSKLIHGGLRYLETLQLPLVYEALHERSVLLRIAPHLVRKQAFYIPVYRNSRRPAWLIATGLSLYALISGSKSLFKTVPKRLWDSVLPGLEREGLQTVFRYWDGATDDTLLTRAVAASARQLGAEIREGTALQRARHESGIWTVELSNGDIVDTQLLVNATGPWIEEVQGRIDSTLQVPALDYVQGTHIIFPQSQEAFVYVEATDRRAVFVMPWGGKTLVGTTETAFTGDPGTVRPTPGEIAELCAVYHRYYPTRPWQPDAIAASFAGIRVLPRVPGSFTRRSRSTLLLTDSRKQPAMLTVCGGKLTTYRITAEKAMRLLRRALPPAKRRTDTAQLPLPAVD